MENLNSREKKIYDNLQSIDPQLGPIYLSALRIKDDTSIPDRFALAAHSCRELCNQMWRKIVFKKEPTHCETLHRVIHNWENVEDIHPFVFEKGGLLAKEWHELHIWFTAISHHEKTCSPREFNENWEEVEKILEQVLSPSYEKIDELDIYFQIENPTDEQVEQLISLLTKQGYYEYFFYNLKSPHWLKPLKDKGIFSKPPEPVKTGLLRFPPWPASIYLVKIADKEPVHVLEIIKQTKTENFTIHQDFVDAALKMPAGLSKELVSLVPDWIRKPFSGYLLTEKLSELIVKLCIEGEAEAAFTLAGILLDVTIDKPSKEAKSYFDSWEYENIVKKVIPRLSKASPLLTVKLLADELYKAICLKNETDNIKDGKYDGSFIWHPAIEDHEQNKYADDVKNILIFTLRDTLMDLGRNNAKNISENIFMLRQYRYPIFKRIELHLLRIFPELCRDTIIEVLLNKELFDNNVCIRHEYFLLLQAQFPNLPTENQQRILQWIEEGPDEKWTEVLLDKEPTIEELERKKRYWQLKHLFPIKDSLLKQWRQRYEQLVAEFGEPEHPEFVSHTVSWIGPTSPLTKEELTRKTPVEILNYLIKWEPPEDVFAPSPEGLGRILTEEVKSRPQEFAVITLEFLRQKVRPTYIHHIIEGFSQCDKEKREFDWEPVINLCEEITISAALPEPSVHIGEHESGWREVRLAICRLLEGGLNESSVCIPFLFKKRVWFILSELMKDPEPTIEYEKKYMDPFTLSINTVRGEAMHSVIRYGLWCARNEPEEAHSRMSQELKTLLTNYLDPRVEPTMTIRSVYGRYLPWLFYLDKEWFKDNLRRIFPTAKEEQYLWKVAWDAYVTFCDVYSDVYFLVKEEYQRAFDFFADHSYQTHLGDPNNKLAEHLVVLYLRGKETLEKGSLLDQFLKKAPLSVRKYAIKFVGLCLMHLNGEKPSKQLLEQLKKLWEYRISKAKEASADKKFSEELKEFGWWFSQNPFDPLWAIARLKETLELTEGDIEQSTEVVRKLSEYFDLFPVQILECLFKIIYANVTNRRSVNAH